MATASPNTPTTAAVIAAATLAKGSVTSGTVDLRTAFAGRLYLMMGRGGTTAIGTALTISVRARYNNANTVVAAPTTLFQLNSSTTAAASTTVNADSNSGQSALNVTSITGFAAGDNICIQDSNAGVTRLEFAKVSKTATGVLTLDRNLLISHSAANGDTVRNQADIFSPLIIPGGALYEVVFDYGAAATGDTATIAAYIEEYVSDNIA